VVGVLVVVCVQQFEKMWCNFFFVSLVIHIKILTLVVVWLIVLFHLLFI